MPKSKKPKQDPEIPAEQPVEQPVELPVEPTTEQQPVEVPKTYLFERLEALGITDEMNTIALVDPDADFPMDGLRQYPIFESDQNDNIIIRIYSVTGLVINYEKKGTGKMSQVNAKTVQRRVIRLKEPIYDAVKDQTTKYLMPKGTPALPFFHPNLVEYCTKKIERETLFLTEGIFKAFKGCMHGLDVVGLMSYTTLGDRSLNEIHPDILHLIKECKYKKVVLLLDGDCLDPLKAGVKEEEYDEFMRPTKLYAGGKDLYKRPNSFFQSINKFRDLLIDYNVDLYFAHPLSSELDGNPKGLDDVLVAYAGRENEIAEDLLRISKPGAYFFKLNITASAYSKLSKHFLINDVTAFRNHWVELRPTLKSKNFVFHGTQYKYDEQKNECVVEVPGDATQYIRVGTKYYKKIKAVNQHGQLEERLDIWDVGTIKQDYGAKFIAHIPKYEAFCNLPSHDNFQQVIYSNYNVYYPIKHPDPEPDDTFERITSLIKHIFGKNDITYTTSTGEEKQINEYDLGLDYVQLLFSKPQEKLPVLCLVSKENETGKSTFCDLLRAIFQGNITSITNQDFKDSFNAHWITKHIVYCSETLLEKAEYSERIKTLSTDHKSNVNTKGVSQFEIDIFIHFILLSNNETSFIRLTEYDTRFWIRKVPVLTNKDPEFLNGLISEVPAFIAFLKQRQMKTKKESRMWFNQQLTRTDALNKVIIYNKPSIEKELRYRITSMFLDFNLDEILMSEKDIKEHFFPGTKDLKYLGEILRDSMKLEQWKDENGLYKTRRYKIPTWVKSYDEKTQEHVTIEGYIPSNGRPYVFKRSEFIDEATESKFSRAKETTINNNINQGELFEDIPF